MSVDPFARNSRLANWRNDLNSETAAEFHLDAAEFCEVMRARGVLADLAIFDPPYSPRQISEVYKSMGREVTTETTQNAALYKRVRDALMPILAPGAIVLSFGWNSAGMGKSRGFELVEQMNVCHGGAHNDTICIAETRIAESQRPLAL